MKAEGEVQMEPMGWEGLVGVAEDVLPEDSLAGA